MRGTECTGTNGVFSLSDDTVLSQCTGIVLTVDNLKSDNVNLLNTSSAFLKSNSLFEGPKIAIFTWEFRNVSEELYLKLIKA